MSGRTQLKHRPLRPGGYIMLGSFQELVDWVTSPSLDNQGRPDVLEIRVVLFHSTGDHPIGAYRRFDLTYDEQALTAVTPATIYTPHLRKARQRQEVKRWYQQLLQT